MILMCIIAHNHAYIVLFIEFIVLCYITPRDQRRGSNDCEYTNDLEDDMNLTGAMLQHIQNIFKHCNTYR
jgi:hypothetical protein